MWNIYGQDHLITLLEAGLKNGRLAQAYLLLGPPHMGKLTLATNLAQALNCLQGPGVPCGSCVQCTRIAQGLHADVRIVRVGSGQEDGPTRTVIGISDVKEVLRQVYLSPYEGRHIVIIFDGAESMSEEAANSLLKTLEEPPEHVTILLLAANEEALLSTIRSRCQRLELRPVPKEQIAAKLESDHGMDAESAETLARQSRGCLGWAIGAIADEQVLEGQEAEVARLSEACQAPLDERFSYANDLAALFSKDRESAKQSLYLWLRWWRDLLLIKEGADEYILNRTHVNELRLHATRLSTVQIVEFVKRLHQTLEALDHNASPRLTLEVLMLTLP